MNYLKLLFIGLLVMSFNCEDDDDNVIFPECLQESIDVGLNQEPTNPRATIDQYKFNGEEVYLINLQNGLEDGMSIVVDENCEEICAIGGIAGLVCEGFDNAEFLRTVWKDPR
jgi:hypothetical protein